MHIYRKDERVVIRAEVNHQPDEEVQSQDLQPEIQSRGPSQRPPQEPVAHGSQTEEPLIQKEQYPVTFNQAINFKCTRAISDALDSYNWNSCGELCKTLDQSGWLLKTPGDVADWNSAIITGKGVEFKLVVEKISTLQSYERLIEH